MTDPAGSSSAFGSYGRPRCDFNDGAVAATDPGQLRWRNRCESRRYALDANSDQ
jgi:hypothetical protein